MLDDDLLSEFDALAAKLANAREALKAVVFGQDEVIDLALGALLAGGHGLIVGAPGLAKTLLVNTIGQVLGLSAKRVQFTPDLMPGDVIGSEVLEESADGKRAFRFVKGPVFCQLLMADEINRASPRTQSALLQAMQERHVTVAGERHDLPAPFHVLATQNPIEQEGTYPLPEAQLDRFLVQINIDYPTAEAEKQMLAATTGTDAATVDAVMTPAELERAQRLVRAMPVAERLVDGTLALTRAMRPTADAPDKMREWVRWGPGPRASQALILTARAMALLDGRRAPSSEDLRRLAGPVLRHPTALTYAALQDGMSTETLINDLSAKHLD